MFFLGFMEAIAEVIVIRLIGVHKVDRDVDDNSVVGHRVVNHKPVNVVMSDKYNIIRL